MTAKELIRELRKILRSRKGRDYPIVICNGTEVEDYHPLIFAVLLESKDSESDHISLNTERSCQSLDHWQAGLRLPEKIESN